MGKTHTHKIFKTLAGNARILCVYGKVSWMRFAVERKKKNQNENEGSRRGRVRKRGRRRRKKKAVLYFHHDSIRYSILYEMGHSQTINFTFRREAWIMKWARVYTQTYQLRTVNWKTDWNNTQKKRWKEKEMRTKKTKKKMERKKAIAFLVSVLSVVCQRYCWTVELFIVYLFPECISA